MHILCLGFDDAYAIRRLRQEARKRRMRFDILEPKNIALATHEKHRLADALIVRTQQPQWIPHALTLARLYRKAGKLVVDAALTQDVTIYSKLNDMLVLSEHGVPVPRSVLCPARRSEQTQTAQCLGYPLVIKSIHGAGGKQVWLAKNAKQLTSLISLSSPQSLMLQEYIDAAYDFRVIVIGYRALPMILRRFPKRNDFRTNARLARRVEALPITQFPNIKKIAERSAKILRREFTGIDIRSRIVVPERTPTAVGGSRRATENMNTPLVLEVNRQPEFETFEKITGLNVAGAFLEYVAKKVSPLLRR